MAKDYADQRKQRQQDYQERMKEAAIQRAEQIAEARKQAADQIALARAEQAQRLADLKTAFEAQRIASRKGWEKALSDMGWFVNAAVQYAQKMAEAGAKLFLSQNLPTAGSLGSTASRTTVKPTAQQQTLFQRTMALVKATLTKDEGGYAEKGTYNLAMNGVREFIMSGPTTKMAERMIGGTMTQQKLLMQLAGGGKGNVTLNDHRRFDSSLSMQDRNVIREDTVNLLESVLRG
jgi:hypothetical protein